MRVLADHVQRLASLHPGQDLEDSIARVPRRAAWEVSSVRPGHWLSDVSTYGTDSRGLRSEKKFLLAHRSDRGERR